MTNFEAVFIHERGVGHETDGQNYYSHEQAWPIRIRIKLLAVVSAEKIAFLCEVFLKFCFRYQVVSKASITQLYHKQVLGDTLTHIKLASQQIIGRGEYINLY